MDPVEFIALLITQMPDGDLAIIVGLVNSEVAVRAMRGEQDAGQAYKPAR